MSIDFSGNRTQARLYWGMRLGVAFIWLWTATVSWLFWPHATSVDWLRQLGIHWHTAWFFVAACVVDLLLGIASCTYPSRRLWQMQFALVVFYSLAIAVALPEFLLHPFGPISKNIAVLACLAFLITTEKRR